MLCIAAERLQSKCVTTQSLNMAIYRSGTLLHKPFSELWTLKQSISGVFEAAVR